MEIKTYFEKPKNVAQKQYEALRAFYLEGRPAREVAEEFGYTLKAFYSLARDFKRRRANGGGEDPFFIARACGRKPLDRTGEINQIIINLRKKYLSVPEVKSVLDALGHAVSEKYVYNVIRGDGFARLPRREAKAKEAAISEVKGAAPTAELLSRQPETFTAQNGLGILCLLPYLQKFGVLDLIENSSYPQTKSIPRINSILSFLALKLANVKRYSADDAWRLDRGLGLFAGLNVLPKAAWFSSYSHRVTRNMNREFLKGLAGRWREHGLLGDTANLDFTTIPYWGDDSHLERNWSGTRRHELASVFALLAQEPDSDVITYGDAGVRHDRKSEAAIEFLDFYQSNGDGSELKYLVFDSGFTTYQNLARLDQAGVKFLTIRRRGKRIVKDLEALPASAWKKVRVPMADGKGRTLRVNDDKVRLRDYGKDLRQIAITGHGKIKPALLITNDFERAREEMIQKYARRWLVEKCISEQIEFFHLNRVSSSMAIKVDFDLTMSILAHNALRLFAKDLPGYSHNTASTLYAKFLQNSGSVEINRQKIIVRLKKKRNLPLLLTAMKNYAALKISSLGQRTITIDAETTT